MKSKITYLILLLTIPTSIFADVFMTELTDPQNSSDAGRYVELYNNGVSDVDLSVGWTIQRWTNANPDPTSSSIKDLTGTIAAGGFYIICNDEDKFSATYGLTCDQDIGTGGAADSNGDDNMAILLDGVIVDMFGVAGEDGSGTGHEFEDGRAERAEGVSGANPVWDVAEWNIDNDSGGGDGPQYAPEDFDPFSWIGSGGGGGNISPSADAGADQLVSTGETVTLDGSGSTDSDGMVIAFEWTQTSGSPVTLSDYESDIVTFTAPDEGGELEFQLTVWDDELEPDTDNVTVTVCGGLVSIAEARSGGIGQCLSVQGIVTSPNFQSSNSEYTIQDDSAGLVVFAFGVDMVLNYGDEINVTGITDEYNGKFELVVENPANVIVIGPGTIPDPQVMSVGEFIADAENFESVLITLSGVSMVSGTWPEEGSSENITISDGSGETTMRIDNDTDIDGSLEPGWPVDVTGVGGQYDYSDPYDSGYQILPRFVSDFEVSSGNLLPIADAGDNQFVTGGDEVSLNGLNSYDPDGEIVGYVWTQTEGTPVTLSDYEEPVVTFTAPMEDGVLVFNLEVFDDTGASTSDDVSVIIADAPMSIMEIQTASDPGEGLDCYPSPYAGQQVFVTGVVTAVQPGSSPRFYLQDPYSDAFSGVYVFDYSVAPTVGDELLLSAEVEEYYGFTELQNVSASTTLSSGNTVGSYVISTGELADGCSLSGETFEGMLVRLENVTVVEETNGYGEWIVDDGSGPCQIDDQMFDGEPEVYPVGTTIGSIVGVIDYAYSAYGVNPRNADDINLEGGCTANGDTNNDESVDVLDIVQIVGYILGNTSFTDEQYCIADVNADLSVDVLDVVMIVNWILNPRAADATSVSITRDENDISFTSDGYVGAIQMTLMHSEDFELELTDHVFAADYNTIDNFTKLIIIVPETDHLFTANGAFEIQDVVAANSTSYITVDIPESFALLNSYPNPFNPNVTLSYYLPSDSHVELAVYSISGTKVASLTNGFLLKGNYQAIWNGKDNLGNEISSGIYLVRLETSNSVITNKVTLLK